MAYLANPCTAGKVHLKVRQENQATLTPSHHEVLTTCKTEVPLRLADRLDIKPGGPGPCSLPVGPSSRRHTGQLPLVFPAPMTGLTQARRKAPPPPRTKVQATLPVTGALGNLKVNYQALAGMVDYQALAGS